MLLSAAAQTLLTVALTLWRQGLARRVFGEQQQVFHHDQVNAGTLSATQTRAKIQARNLAIHTGAQPLATAAG